MEEAHKHLKVYPTLPVMVSLTNSVMVSYDEFRHGELDEPWAKPFAMAFLTFRQAQGDGWLKVTDS